jgi:hypothetical protein
LGLSLGKLIVGAIALALFNSVARVISRARDANCADPDDVLTKRTFVDLDNEIEGSVNSLWTQVTIDMFNIVMATLAFLLAHMKGLLHSSNKSSELTNEKQQPHVAVGAADEPSLVESSPVASLTYRSGWYLDCVKLTLRDGEEKSYGGNGGNLQPIKFLDEGDYITSVQQYQGNRQYLGAGLIFTTFKGKAIGCCGSVLSGGMGKKIKVSKQEKGCHIVGLKFRGYKLEGVEKAYLPGTLPKHVAARAAGGAVVAATVSVTTTSF